jgi:hypothetical protein
MWRYERDQPRAEEAGRVSTRKFIARSSCGKASPDVEGLLQAGLNRIDVIARAEGPTYLANSVRARAGRRIHEQFTSDAM